MISTELPGIELARVIGNALAFVPARCPVGRVALWVWSDGVEASGTDGIIGGRDWAAGTAPEDAPGDPGDAGALCLLSRENAVELERMCRIEAKKTAVRLTFDPVPSPDWTDGAPGTLRVEWTGEDPETGEGRPEMAEAPILPDGHDAAIYRVLRELLDVDAGLPARPVNPTGPLALNPAYFPRFAKVKADKTERVMDLYLTSEMADGREVYGRILVRIGPTFVGLYMPIDRDTHAERVGQDGLW